MEFPERISAGITAVIASHIENYSEEKLAEINYGIAVFITNSYKMLIMLLLAALLGILKHWLVAVVSFGLLRSFASGVHAKREWTCLPSSIIVFFGIVYLGRLVEFNALTISLIYALCFAAMLKYSPADTQERPIVSTRLRRKLKIMSCLTLLALYAVSLIYLGKPVSAIAALSSLAESAMIVPITYILTGSKYGTGIRIN